MESTLVSLVIAEVPDSRRIVDANTPDERVVADWRLQMIVAGRAISLGLARKLTTADAAAHQFAQRFAAALGRAGQ